MVAVNRSYGICRFEEDEFSFEPNKELDLGGRFRAPDYDEYK